MQQNKLLAETVQFPVFAEKMEMSSTYKKRQVILVLIQVFFCEANKIFA